MKITKLARSISISSFTIVDDLLTVITTTPHLLLSADTVTFSQNKSNVYTVTVINSTTFTVPYTITYDNFKPMVCYAFDLRSTATRTIGYAIGSTVDSSSTFQVLGKTTAGAGSAVVSLDVSNDNINWLSFGTITLTLSTTISTDGLVLAAPWAYVRANATTLTGTNTSVNILMGSNS